MSPQQTFRPFEYSSSRPVQTLFNLINRSWLYYVTAILVLIIKHSPMWAIPFLIARVINTLAEPIVYPALRPYCILRQSLF